MGERTIFVEFMLGCLLDAMLNYKPEEDADYEGVQDKMQDKMQDNLHYKLHDVRKVNNKKCPPEEGI